MDIQKMIANHTDSIVKGDFSSPTIACRNCRQKTKPYKLHESRKRQFRIVVKDIVTVTISFLLRWKCLVCGTTFTVYPPFAVPYKQFILSDILNFGERYLKNDDLSYRDIVKYNGANIGYPGVNNLCDKFVSHSSVWRFIGYLSGMYKSNMGCLRIPDREIPPVISPSKYRSHNRKTILSQAFKTTMLFNRYLKKKFFPDFETGYT